MINVSNGSTLLGFIAAIAVLILVVCRQKRLELSDLGSLGAAYFAGSNVPAALFLCWYTFDPDPATVQTKLHGYEKYVSFAGLAILVFSIITIWSQCQKAYALTSMASKTAPSPSTTQPSGNKP